MEDTFVIDSMDQLKTFADPLRQRILQVLCCTSATTKQIAGQLGEKPTRLYHHVDLLEKAGFIKIVDRKQNRGTVEKYYQAVAYKFVIDHAFAGQAGIEAGKIPEVQNVIINTLQASLVDARDFFVPEIAEDEGKKEIPLMVSQTNIRLSEVQVNTFVERCCSLVEELGVEELEEGGELYSLTLALFPIRKERTIGAEL